MKITGPTGPGGPSKKKDKKSEKTGDASLFNHLMQGPGEVTHAAASESVSSISPLIGLQEVDVEAQKRQQVERAESLLDQLEEIRRCIVLGELPVERLRQLKSLLAGQKQRLDNPDLQKTIEEIELRAAVELAKLEKNS